MNETRITDYALNELQGDERERFESDLATNESLQTELQAASGVVDSLTLVMSEPSEGLEPQARERLLLAIAENQRALRHRGKLTRLVVPFSLAAAASITLLMLVLGGKTAQEPVVTAADGDAIRDRPVGFVAELNSERDSAMFRGDGHFSNLRGEGDGGSASGSFEVHGIRNTASATRTISMSESARVARELREDGGLSLTSPAVRMKPLTWDDNLTRLGSMGE